MKRISIIAIIALLTQSLCAEQFHVSVNGSDKNDGSASKPFKTISTAAEIAQAGDVITVHQGTYRERVNPPRGGTSDSMRIVYQAAEGEQVVIKGSEVVTGWKRVRDGVWKVKIPNTFFANYNPYKVLISGDWFNPRGRQHHTGEVYLNGNALFEDVSLDKINEPGKKNWYCQSDDQYTYIWANFDDLNPNEQLVEINVRPTCFYPDKPGRNYITVSGFQMSQAATQWAAPTAEQIAMVGTHWSKGWIIENNRISDSKCVGITLGKDRESGHNKLESADGYNNVVKIALENGWSKEKIGSHIVRNNTIYNCGAAGICGSMGGAFSQVTGNHIYNIHINKPFSGAEMAGIKLHAPIDTLIKNNRIHDTCLAIWLDWMTQGTRVTANLCYNSTSQDLFVEVNHGPYVIDNNIFLSKTALRDWSQGGAFAHNIFAGKIRREPQSRKTPYHKEHSTQIQGLSNTRGGDNRFYNNIFLAGKGLNIYDDAALSMYVDGNLYLNGTAPYHEENNFIKLTNFNPNLRLIEQGDGVYLNFTLPPTDKKRKNQLVTTELLGKAAIPNLPYENPDTTDLKVDTDYFDNKRNEQNPSPGPFENPGEGNLSLKVWPLGNE
ncbi:MAG: right-handed parallel beta-helix repeat-containing protein [Planctomycetota bacterium]|jgi:hypothetical protein